MGLFSYRIINVWNNLPDYVVNSSTVNSFKSLFDFYFFNSRFIFILSLQRGFRWRLVFSQGCLWLYTLMKWFVSNWKACQRLQQLFGPIEFLFLGYIAQNITPVLHLILVIVTKTLYFNRSSATEKNSVLPEMIRHFVQMLLSPEVATKKL